MRIKTKISTKPIAFSEAAERFLRVKKAAKVRPRTLKDYEIVFNSFLKVSHNTLEFSVLCDDLLDFFSTIPDTSPAVYNRPYSCLHALFNWCVLDYIIPSNPLTKLGLKKRKDEGTIHDKLTECVITGKTTSQLKKFLQDEFGVSYNRADTIVRTEMAHIQTQAARQRYQEYGIQEIEIYADTDNRTCPICTKLDGKRFGINDALPIPAHPRCRCCALPVIKEEVKEQLFTPEPESTIIKPKEPAPPTVKSENSDSSDEEKLNQITSKFPKYGTAILPRSAKITHGGTHADKRFEQRGVTLEDAQHYIDTAYICFQQSKDKVMYLSEDGVVVVLGNRGLATVYPKSRFDETIQELLKEVKRLWKK